MKNTVRIILAIVFLLILTAGWVYLYMNSRAVNADKQNATLVMLKDMKQIDSDWNADVLKSQTEIIRSYDALTKPLRSFTIIFNSLDREIKSLKDEELNKAMADIHSVIDKKAMLVDRFKAQNSLLKNSLRYAPTAYKDIQEQMKTKRDSGMSAGSRLNQDMPGAFDEIEKLSKGDKSDEEASKKKLESALVKLRANMKQMQQANVAAKNAFTLVHLDSNISALVSESLKYNSVPDSETAEFLKVGTTKMREAIPTYPDYIRESVENLMSHVDAILRLRTKQTDLLQEITSIPVPAKVDALSTVLTKRFDVELQQQNNYQRLLLGYSALALLIVFGGSGFIIYRSATERKRLIVLVDKQTRELKENEVQLVHAQKMNALGEMVAGITHEVNTPLAAVKSGIQSSVDLLGVVQEYVEESSALATMLSAKPPADEAGKAERKVLLGQKLMRANELREELASFDALATVTQLLNEGVKNVEYIHQVVVNMLNFSRLDRSRISSVKLEEGIETTLVIAKHFLKKVSVVKEYGDTVPVSCDIAQLNQVILNLIKNGAQALPDMEGEIKIQTSMPSTKEVQIAISDNGTGIPPDILAKIWEPFFTTKKAGSGTGLGLSTCKKIIDSHGGEIEVKSIIGKGTTFYITLPVQPPSSLYEEHGQEMNSQFMDA
jgi:two-component system NtrC family sensor kinase